MKVLVVGSGATGVHFALTALSRNHDVTMVDVGTERPAIPLPTEDFTGLKSGLGDPVRYFLGKNYEAAILPELTRSNYYTLPPSKNYVFEAPKHFGLVSEGISPLVSFAAGGLAEAWAGGCYALSDPELQAFPFTFREIQPHYGEVARRIGIAGAEDDLSEFFPQHDYLSPPPVLDNNSKYLLASYEKRRSVLLSKYGIRMGASRQAVLTEGRDGRNGCRYCGRCVWGCPNGAFYTPYLSLQQCTSFPKFEYRSGLFASHFDLGSDWCIEKMVTYPVRGGSHETFSADAYVLACGTLSSSNLILRSVYKSTGEILRLSGLTDNPHVLVPFLNLKMLGQNYAPDTYQYHQLAIGLAAADPTAYVHGQITTLKAATVHPILQGLPVDLASAVRIFGDLRSALGVVNLFFSDARREESYLTLEHTDGDTDKWPKLSVHYKPDVSQLIRIRSALSKVRRFFRHLGAPTLPGMTQMHPMPWGGAHYSGTIPMSREKKSWCLSEECRSWDIPNMFVIDGSAIPSLPAKNLTFTLMANAVRVAETAF